MGNTQGRVVAEVHYSCTECGHCEEDRSDFRDNGDVSCPECGATLS